jgi:hypothetical protein
MKTYATTLFVTLVFILRGSVLAAQDTNDATILGAEADPIVWSIPDKLGEWNVKLKSDTLKVPVQVFFPKDQFDKEIEIECHAELVQESKTCDYKFAEVKLLKSKLKFHVHDSLQARDKNVELKEEFTLVIDGTSNCLNDISFLRLEFSDSKDNDSNRVLRNVKIIKAETEVKIEIAYSYEFLYDQKRYHATIKESKTQNEISISCLSESSEEQPENVASNFTSYDSEEFFVKSFEEAFPKSETSEITDADQKILASKASIFYAQIQAKRKVEAEKAGQLEYKKGFAKAQEEFDSGPIVPAGILALTTTELDISEYRDGSQILKIDSVVISINNSVLDQVNVYGVISLKRSPPNPPNVSQKKKKSQVTVDELTVRNVHFYNNSFSVSLNQILTGASSLPETVKLKNGQEETIWLNLSDILSYRNSGSQPLSQRVRSTSFTLSASKPTKSLERHKITDYIETAVYSDVFGLQGSTGGSLFLTDITFNYPVNTRNYGRTTLMASIDVLFNVARIGNEESAIKTKAGKSRLDSRDVQYVSIFDYLEYYSLMNYVGLNLVSHEIKSIESRVNLFGGLTVFRTNVEINQGPGVDLLKAKILSPSGTFGLNYNKSFLDNKMGLTVDARAMFLTPTRQPEFSYTDNARTPSNDTLYVGVDNNNMFWVQVYELKGYYQRESGGKFFARLRYFDTWTSRDAYMQFFIGYSVPISAIKL